MMYAELVVFDDDGPEGFYKRTEHESSWSAAVHFVNTYDVTYHCSINQINTGQSG